mmetsp:Transcript_43398/g.64338  ORF Transcript_43398/g.64338 Transcript_43398/m.64338 type:complete len:88 (+) Transcript_43398:671-934(+)
MSATNPTPMATAPLNMTSRGSEKTTTTTTSRYSPVVTAMLHNNHMHNCQEVDELYAQCMASGAEDRICKTASNYFSICLPKRKEMML